MNVYNNDSKLSSSEFGQLYVNQIITIRFVMEPWIKNIKMCVGTYFYFL